MSKENALLVLWIIFGFVFIQALDAIINLFNNLIYFGLSELSISYTILKFLIPIISLSTYIIVVIAVLKKIKTKSNSSGIYLTEFPRAGFIILALIAIFLNPFTNKLAGLYAENNSFIQSENSKDYIEFYGWKTMGMHLSKWVILITLVFVYLTKYNSRRIKN
jgi:hypothetical protein